MTSPLADERRLVAEYCAAAQIAAPTARDRADAAQQLRAALPAERGAPAWYLTVTAAARHARVQRSAFLARPLPPPDALFGADFEGWLPASVERWRADRDGAGGAAAAGPVRYLGPFEIADLLGVDRTTLARYRMPAPDAIVGRRSGWLPGTIAAWNLVRQSITDPIADQI